MGQYYAVFNIDKKEYYIPRFTEMRRFIYAKTPLGEGSEKIETFISLMTGPWSGDRVYLIGNYANYNWAKREIKRPDAQTFIELTREFTWLLKENSNFFTCHHEGFTEVYSSPSSKKVRYFVNEYTKEYIDLAKTSKSVGSSEYSPAYIFPPLLLLAIGNGHSDSDYSGDNYDKVGLWTPYSKYLLFSYHKPPSDYQEIHFPFS